MGRSHRVHELTHLDYKFIRLRPQAFNLLQQKIILFWRLEVRKLRMEQPLGKVNFFQVNRKFYSLSQTHFKQEFVKLRKHFVVCLCSENYFARLRQACLELDKVQLRLKFNS